MDDPMELKEQAVGDTINSAKRRVDVVMLWPIKFRDDAGEAVPL